MNALLALLVRHLLAAGGGFFAAHNITGDSTTSIVIGVGIAAISLGCSAVAKVFHLDDKLAGCITDSQVLRIFLGALVSQAVTWLSTYFAIDANSPELLGVAVINAGLSKFGAHQKLAMLGSKDAVNLFLVLGSLCCVSCSALTDLVIKAAPLIEEGVVYGVRSGVQAGVKELQRRKLDAKQPRDVTPKQEGSAVVPSGAAQPDRSSPPCLVLISFRRAANDVQGEPALPRSPVMKQSGVSIPLLGNAVAHHLASIPAD